MARLQRKKTSGGKKKKKQAEAAGASVATFGAGADAQQATAEKPALETKKKKSPVPKRAVSVSRSEPGKIRGYWEKSVQFLREVRVELKKVTWPSRQQTLGSTVVVLILVMIISLFLGLSDIALSGRDPCRSSIDRGGDHRGAKMVHRSCIFRV